MDELLGEFLAETTEGLATLDSNLLLLEQNVNDHSLISGAFRVVHTIKGTCGFFDLPRLEVLAHACENLLGQLRDKKLQPSAQAVSLVLKAADRIRSILVQLEATESEPEGGDGDLIAALNAFISEGSSGVDMEVEQAESPAPILYPIPEIAESASDWGRVTSKGTECPEPSDASDPLSATGGELSASAASIRVHVDLLEDLMTAVSELVLTRNQLMQILRAEKDSAFSAPLQRLSHLTSELQESVMRTRMQPIRHAWAKLPRLVRDLSIELDKKIELKLSGSDTELDRQVLELIKDPIIHMVRNSADHGIECPALRVLSGKLDHGTISLKAYHEGGHIMVEITDDGRGLNTASIRAKIIEKRLLSEADLQEMTAKQIHQFIFKPGFSTADCVTSISGRGVGMDVVLSNIEKIGGTIDLRSQEGQGSTITIKIPLTLSIVSVLIVESSGTQFAVPQVSVEELILPKGRAETRVETVNGSSVLWLRGHLLPLISLSTLLLLSAPAYLPEESHIVVMRLGGQSFGLIVDDVHDCEEIVVKPVAKLMRHIPLYNGNTILGDGSVIMILNPTGIATAMGFATQPLNTNEKFTSKNVENIKKISFFVFKAGDQSFKAMPLGQITRLEEIDRQRIEFTNDRAVIQYRGRLMPLIAIDPNFQLVHDGIQQIIVFSDDQRCMGLLVDQIVDIVEDELNIQFGSDRPGFIGSAVIGGRATDILDTSYYLTQAYADWFVPASELRGEGQGCRKRILLLDDSELFRHLAIPVLKLAGYDVRAVGSVDRALALCADGAEFDAIITDIEMPGKNGFDFAETLQGMARWRHIPVIALSSRVTSQELARARALKFTDFIPKFDRVRLLDALAMAVGSQVSQRFSRLDMEAA